MAEILNYIKDNQIPVIFKEKMMNDAGKFAQTVADEANIDVQILDPLEADPKNGKTYLENLEENLKTLNTYLN